MFALTVGKDGPKIASAKGDRFGGGQQMARGGDGYRTLAFKDTSMQDFAVMLLDHVVRLWIRRG